MEIDRIAVALRPRDIREAMDLGAAILRRYGRPIWAAWVVLTLPFLAIAVALSVLLGSPWLSILLLWWLKPFFARVPLFVLSRAVFAQAPDWRATLRGVFAWGATGMPGWLTLARPDARRAIRQPLVYLEGLDRSERAQRWKVFGRGLGGPSYAITLACLEFELVIAASVLLFVPLLVPRELWSGAVFNGIRWNAIPVPFGVALVMAYYAAISVIEPLYTSTGFAIYLNRRTELEAWDIDLSFRRLRDRLLAAGAAVAMLVLGVFAWPAPAQAATPGTRPEATATVDSLFAKAGEQTDARTATAAAKVFADPRFGGERKTMAWGLKDRFVSAKPPVQERPIDMASTMTGFASTVKILLILGLASVVACLGWFAVRHIGKGEPAAVPPAVNVPTDVVVSSAVASVPVQLADTVRSLWRGGERRDALALLYRGTVERLAGRLDIAVPVDATEADAIARARQLDDAEAGSRVARIVRTWQFAAYADRYPSDDEIAVLLTGWPAESS